MDQTTPQWAHNIFGACQQVSCLTWPFMWHYLLTTACVAMTTWVTGLDLCDGGAVCEQCATWPALQLGHMSNATYVLCTWLYSYTSDGIATKASSLLSLFGIYSLTYLAPASNNGLVIPGSGWEPWGAAPLRNTLTYACHTYTRFPQDQSLQRLSSALSYYHPPGMTADT